MASDTGDLGMDSSAPIEAVPLEERCCVDCVHLLGVRYDIDEAETLWRCVHPQNVVRVWKDVVTGTRQRDFKMIFIREVRTQLCIGNWWELYKKPEYRAALDSTPTSAASKKPEYKPQTIKPSALKSLKLEDL